MTSTISFIQRLPEDLKTTIFQFDLTFHQYFKVYIEPMIHAYNVYRVESNSNDNLFLIVPRSQACEDFNALLTNDFRHPSFITLSYEDNQKYLSYFTIRDTLRNIRRSTIQTLIHYQTGV